MITVPSDEELRKVAEDVRALARSLARDFWDAKQSAERGGRPAADALKHGIRDAAEGARREFQRGMRHHWHGWGPPPPRRPRRGGPPGFPFGPPGPGQEPATSGVGLAGDRAGQTTPQYPPGWVGSPWVNPHRRAERHGRGHLPPVRRRWDASVLAALLVVVFGVAWLVGGLGAVHLSTEAVLAAGLMLLGAALVVTARTDWSLSRHAWPVILGGVLVVGLLATSATFGVNGALSHMSIGNMNPTVSAQGGTVYGGLGQLTVHAQALNPGSTLKVESIAGETDISLPPGATVDVNAKVLAGQVCVAGHPSSSGVGADYVGTAESGSGLPITLDVHQLAGQVMIDGIGRGCRGQ